MSRLETGIVCDGDDWPGVFIRGDDAFAYQLALRSALRQMPNADASIEARMARNAISGLADLLEKSNMNSPAHQRDKVQKIKRE